MTRSVWVLFGLVLMMVGDAAVMRVTATGKEERAAASGGVGGVTADGGEGISGEMDTGPVGGVGGDDRGVGCRARLEEGEGSSIGSGNDSTFQDLPELSSGSHPLRLRQGTIFEMFEAETRHRRQSGERTSAPAIERRGWALMMMTKLTSIWRRRHLERKRTRRSRRLRPKSIPLRFTIGQRGGGSTRAWGSLVGAPCREMDHRRATGAGPLQCGASVPSVTVRYTLEISSNIGHMT